MSPIPVLCTVHLQVSYSSLHLYIWCSFTRLLLVSRLLLPLMMMLTFGFTLQNRKAVPHIEQNPPPKPPQDHAIPAPRGAQAGVYRAALGVC